MAEQHTDGPMPDGTPDGSRDMGVYRKNVVSSEGVTVLAKRD